jgi:hypothetical protein
MAPSPQQYDSMRSQEYSAERISSLLSLYIEDMFRTREAVIRLEKTVTHVESCVVAILVLLILTLICVVLTVCAYSCQRYQQAATSTHTLDRSGGGTAPRKPIEL